MARPGTSCRRAISESIRLTNPTQRLSKTRLLKRVMRPRVPELPALADDSGLCVESLNGAPGVLSARFAGEDATDQSNNAELLRRLSGVTQRRAHYTCVLVAVRSAEDAEPIIVDARWYGEIAKLRVARVDSVMTRCFTWPVWV